MSNVHDWFAFTVTAGPVTSIYELSKSGMVVVAAVVVVDTAS
jgi:hypothetical protein